jgi:hypothetical protein
MTSALNHEPVFFYNVNYLIFDNFEFKGYCWDKTAGSYLYEVGNNLQFNRLYFHGWTYVSEVGANCTGGYCDVNHMITGSGNAGIFAFNTFDGSDSSPMSGFAMYQQNAYDVHGTVCRHLSDCAVLVGTHTFHDNLAELMTYSYDGTSHANTWEFMDNYGGNNLYYNNIIRNTSAYGAPGTWWRLGTQTSTDYVFNNVIYGVNASYPTSDNCFMIAQPVANTTTNAVYFYNNTFDNCVVQTNGNSVTHPFYGTLNFENNQFIGYPAQNLAGVWQNGSGSGAGGATAVDLGGQVYQTEAKANSQGYTPSNNYAPTSGSGPTVGAGSNLTSLCNIASALCTDTTLGDTRTPNARPRSAAWDGGAYLFIDTNPLPPANVTATPH